MLKLNRISSNAVYPFYRQGTKQFLRLSPAPEKLLENLRGELEFLCGTCIEDTDCSDRILFAYGQALARAQQPSCKSSMGLLLLQITLFYVVLKDLIRHLIQFLRSQLRFSLSVIYLTGSHIVRPPVPATVAVVQQQRLDIVHRVCKF